MEPEGTEISTDGPEISTDYSVPAGGSEEYSKQSYWDKRFATEQQYDWLCNLEQVEHYFDRDFPRPRSKYRLLVIGCGNSALTAELSDAGFTNIVSTDYSEKVVANMREKYEATTPISSGQWQTARISRTLTTKVSIWSWRKVFWTRWCRVKGPCGARMRRRGTMWAERYGAFRGCWRWRGPSFRFTSSSHTLGKPTWTESIRVSSLGGEMILSRLQLKRGSDSSTPAASKVNTRILNRLSETQENVLLFPCYMQVQHIIYLLRTRQI